MISFKRGSTFMAEITLNPVEGGIQSLLNTDIKSQIRRQNGDIIADVNVIVAADYKSFNCEVTETDEWPIGILEWDIKFEQVGIEFFSETLELQVIRSVTRD